MKWQQMREAVSEQDRRGRFHPSSPARQSHGGSDDDGWLVGPAAATKCEGNASP